ILGAGRTADAACNLIPQRTLNFAGAVGGTNRPYAAPGESVEVSLRPCDVSHGFIANAGAQVVTLIYTPVQASAPRNVVVLATDCSALGPAVSTCGGTPGVAGVTCLTVTPGADLNVRT